MTRHITLCADDYGLHPAINAGILQLVEQRRLSAVSCMSQSALWPRAAVALSPYRPHLAVGLHFNLTEHLVTTDQSLGQLLMRISLGRLDEFALKENLNRQLDLFEEYWHASPDYVDGHQHVHALPRIRTVFLQIIKERYGTRLPALRDPAGLVSTADAPMKGALLRRLCGSFREQALAAGFKLNSAFAGVYSLSEQADIAALFSVWLRQLPDGGLLMCHPANETHEEQYCAHIQARRREFAYLSGPRFIDLLDRSKVRLSTTIPAVADAASS